MWGRRSYVRMVQIITTERSQHQRELWLRMVWTLTSYSLQKWYLLAVELATAAAIGGVGRNVQSIPSIIQRRYYNVFNWPPETFFKGQRTRFGNTASIYHQPTEVQLRVNTYCIFLFQMGGNLDCIRCCIYDSTASSLCSSVFPLFHSNPAHFLLCNKMSYLFSPIGTFFFLT